MFNLIEQVLIRVGSYDYQGVNATLACLLEQLRKHSEIEIEYMTKMNFPFIGTHIVEHRLVMLAIEREMVNSACSNYVNLTAGIEKILIHHIEQYDSLYAAYAKHITIPAMAEA